MTDHKIATKRPANTDVAARETTPVEPAAGAGLDHGADAGLDRLNLDQALRDFELANRRVVDLAHRVTELHRELVEARDELARTKIELQVATRYLDRLRGSRLFPLVQSAARASRALRR